jgi:hypothetical protein
MNDARCLECHGRLDHPGLYGCNLDHHTRPTKAQEIVRAVEVELSRRSGMGWGHLDEDIVEELRDKLARIVGEILTKTV